MSVPQRSSIASASGMLSSVHPVGHTTRGRCWKRPKKAICSPYLRSRLTPNRKAKRSTLGKMKSVSTTTHSRRHQLHTDNGVRDVHDRLHLKRTVWAHISLAGPPFVGSMRTDGNNTQTPILDNKTAEVASLVKVEDVNHEVLFATQCRLWRVPKPCSIP